MLVACINLSLPLCPPFCVCGMGGGVKILSPFFFGGGGGGLF